MKKAHICRPPITHVHEVPLKPGDKLLLSNYIAEVSDVSMKFPEDVIFVHEKGNYIHCLCPHTFKLQQKVCIACLKVICYREAQQTKTQFSLVVLCQVHTLLAANYRIFLLYG